MINQTLKNDKIEEIRKSYRREELMNYDIFDREWPEIVITDESRRNNMNREGLDYRQRMGMYRTLEETKKYIEASLKRPLPGDAGWNKYQRRLQKAKTFGLRLMKK